MKPSVHLDHHPIKTHPVVILVTLHFNTSYLYLKAWEINLNLNAFFLYLITQWKTPSPIPFLNIAIWVDNSCCYLS